MSGKRNYVWNGETFVDVTGLEAPAAAVPVHPARYDGCRRSSRDATGEVMDSKSRFREVTKAHGLVEVGNDYLTNLNPRTDDVKSRKQDIATAIEMVEQGYRPPPVESVSDWADEPTRILGDA